MIRLILIARLVSAPLPRVELVMQAAERAGVDADLVVAMVAVESRWDPAALGDDGASWGLFQLCSRWHPQFRGDLTAHCSYGARYLAECLARDGGSRLAGLSMYNSGRPNSDAGRLYAARVMALYRLVEAQGTIYQRRRTDMVVAHCGMARRDMVILTLDEGDSMLRRALATKHFGDPFCLRTLVRFSGPGSLFPAFIQDLRAAEGREPRVAP